MRWLSRLVTVTLLLAIGVAAVLLVRLAMPSQKIGGHFTAYAMLRDGSKLAVGSPVVIAGVRVGEVSHLIIEGDFARVELELRDDVAIPRDAWIAKRAQSAFGDAYVEIIPPEEEGATSAERLGSGEQITHVVATSSTDDVLRGIDRSLPLADRALQNTHEFLGHGRHWVDSSMRNGVDRASAWLADGKIEAGISAADRALNRIDTGTERAAGSMGTFGPSLRHRLDQIDDAVTKARAKMKDVQGSLADGTDRVQHGLDGIDQPIADYNAYVSAIDEGRGDDWKGKLGRLINDRQPGEDIDEAVQSARDGADKLTRTKAWLGMRIEYNVFSKAARFYATAELRTRPDKFYVVELERDPLGGLPSDELSDAAGTSTYTRTVTIKDQLRFTAQFGKQFSWLQLRGGIKDSQFGVGADALLVEGGRLRLSADAFGGMSSNFPQLKLAAAFAVFRSIYLLAGINDALTRPGYISIDKDSQYVPNDFHMLRYGRDYFVGAALQFDDADLATLLRVYGALLVSAVK